MRDLVLKYARLFLLVLGAGVLFTYVGDFGIYRIEGAPKSQFTVSHFTSAPLKNGKEEIDYTGSESEPCSISLYPQQSLTPCWYLRRHTNQVNEY